MPVFRNEILSTGDAARLELTFDDTTLLTLGANAKVTLDKYTFNPARSRATLRFGVIGAFRFVSGQISKLARSNVSVATPVAVIGIRGTRVLGQADRRPDAWRVLTVTSLIFCAQAWKLASAIGQNSRTGARAR